MGNNELLDTFKEYNPWKARHAYGPQGHRGMSMLIFPESPGGYHDAQRLHKHFTDARRSRDTWDKPGKLLYLPGTSTAPLSLFSLFNQFVFYGISIDITINDNLMFYKRKAHNRHGVQNFIDCSSLQLLRPELCLCQPFLKWNQGINLTCLMCRRESHSVWILGNKRRY